MTKLPDLTVPNSLDAWVQKERGKETEKKDSNSCCLSHWMSFPPPIAAAGRHYPRVGGWGWFSRNSNVREEQWEGGRAGLPIPHAQNGTSPAYHERLGPSNVVFTRDVNKFAGLPFLNIQ
jgi:hypothetical protein